MVQTERIEIMDEMLAVIMAGGKGRRMNILCDSRPKPILPFGGKYRVIDFCLSNCINSQIREIMVLADYRSSDLRTYLNLWRSSWKRSFDQKIPDFLAFLVDHADSRIFNRNVERKEICRTLISPYSTK